MTIRKWLVPKAPGTHVLMDGGILHVPDEDLKEFYQACIQEIRLGRKLYVVEQKTDIFKFFVDVDYVGSEALKPDEILDICNVLNDVVSKGRCCIARAKPRVVEGQIKSGVHVHWPDLLVTRQDALAIRTRILLHLDEDTRDWNKIIDSSVYGGSGLRMLWSHKKPTGDPYTPWRILDGPDFDLKPDVETLELFSVRSTETTHDRIFTQDTTPLETFIRMKFEGQDGSHIKSVVRHANDGWYAQTDSKYCENIKNRHKSNHIWFLISREYVCTQRCFDDDCKGFSGRKHNLSPTIVDQLKNVLNVDNPPRCTIMDCLPEGLRGAFQTIRK
jgi:hypothetical protein